jgi:hypothetical protein
VRIDIIRYILVNLLCSVCNFRSSRIISRKLLAVAHETVETSRYMTLRPLYALD